MFTVSFGKTVSLIPWLGGGSAYQTVSFLASPGLPLRTSALANSGLVVFGQGLLGTFGKVFEVLECHTKGFEALVPIHGIHAQFRKGTALRSLGLVPIQTKRPQLGVVPPSKGNADAAIQHVHFWSNVVETHMDLGEADLSFGGSCLLAVGRDGGEQIVLGQRLLTADGAAAAAPSSPAGRRGSRRSLGGA